MARAERSDVRAELTAQALLLRERWTPLPSFVVLVGDERFQKREVTARFQTELGATAGKTAGRNTAGTEPWLKRFSAAEVDKGKPTLADVLSELCTPSFFGASRLVVIEAADSFLTRERESLEPWLERGFPGGHLILELDSLDLRTRFAKAVAQKGWVVMSRRPFDRPPPWKPDADPWDHDLARWIVDRARMRGLKIDAPTAHALSQRAGNELSTLAEELQKIDLFLGETSRKVTLDVVNAVVGDLREDSIFELVDAFLAKDRRGAARIAWRLLESGYHPPKGAVITEASAIWMLFLGALVSRLTALRRAHALRDQGQGEEAWMQNRLVQKPFLPRFQRDLRASPPERIDRAFDALRLFDRTVKTGGRAEGCIEEMVLRY